MIFSICMLCWISWGGGGGRRGEGEEILPLTSQWSWKWNIEGFMFLNSWIPRARTCTKCELSYYMSQSVQFSSIAQLCPTLCSPKDCSTPGFLSSPTPGACSNSCPLSRWCHPTISSSAVPFSCLQSFPASRSFSISEFFTLGSLCIGASTSASVLPMNIPYWFPLGLTGWISLQSKGFCLLQHHSSKASILWHSAFFQHQSGFEYPLFSKCCQLPSLKNQCSP